MRMADWQRVCRLITAFWMGPPRPARLPIWKAFCAVKWLVNAPRPQGPQDKRLLVRKRRPQLSRPASPPIRRMKHNLPSRFQIWQQERSWRHITVITEKLGRLISWHRSENGNELPPKEEPPLRSELFNVEQLERHARILAASQPHVAVVTGRGTDKLIARLNENESILVQTYELVTRGSQTPAPQLAGCRVAAGQLLPDRGANSHGPAALAAVLQSGTATVGGPRCCQRGHGPTRLRYCPGPDFTR